MVADDRWKFDDGGRGGAGFRGKAGDCFTRAVSIACQVPYREVYDYVNAVAKELKAKELSKQHKTAKQKLRRVTFGDARRGVRNPLFHEVMKRMGWKWVPTMRYGQGCKVHLCREELPPGRIICRVTKHMVAVIDGVIHDTYDPSRTGTRCVYGYFTKHPDGTSAVQNPTPAASTILSESVSNLAAGKPTISCKALKQHENVQLLAVAEANAMPAPFSDDDSVKQVRRKRKRPVGGKKENVSPSVSSGRRRRSRLASAFSDDDSDQDVQCRFRRRRALASSESSTPARVLAIRS